MFWATERQLLPREIEVLTCGYIIVCPAPLQFCFVPGVNTGGFFVVWLLFSSPPDMLSTISASRSTAASCASACKAVHATIIRCSRSSHASCKRLQVLSLSLSLSLWSSEVIRTGKMHITRERKLNDKLRFASVSGNWWGINVWINIESAGRDEKGKRWLTMITEYRAAVCNFAFTSKAYMAPSHFYLFVCSMWHGFSVYL